MEEVWKDVIGYNGLYQVSNLGRVRSLDRIIKNNYAGTIIRKGRILKGYFNKKGYHEVTLSKDSKSYCFSVHQLQMLAFVPNPKNYPMVNHKDENPSNNFIWVNPDGSVDLEKSNLEWCDAKYNVNYGTGIERNRQKQINGVFSKPVLQYKKDGTFIKEYPSTMEVERQTGYNNSNISKCCTHKRHYNSAYGFIWEYKK